MDSELKIVLNKFSMREFLSSSTISYAYFVDVPMVVFVFGDTDVVWTISPKLVLPDNAN